MNNQNFQNIVQNLLKNQQNLQNQQKINRISNVMNTNEGKMLANELNKMANNNPAIQNVINKAKFGDLNSAAAGLSQMMQTKDGQELAKLFSKILGE
ncbi:MAG: hypothetical protein R3Y09_02450 [Clostridia bacterium]